MIIKVFEKGISAISGKSVEFEVEQRHYNIAVFVSLIVAILSYIINCFLGFSAIIQNVILLASFQLIFIYWQSRFRHRFMTWYFVILALIILSASWIYNEGPHGSINFLYMMALLVFLSITERKHHIMVSLMVFINLIILYTIYFIWPNLIIPYPSPEVRENDIFITFLYSSILSALVFSSLRGNYQNEKTKAVLQKAEIEAQHKLITESIIYSRDIQRGLLQNEEDIKKFVNEIFIFWQPKDIIGGDFYSFLQSSTNENRLYCTVADCTGHGVPGALLTMLGLTFFTEIVSRNPNISSDEILNQLRQKFKKSLTQGRVAADNRDGMDMAVCVIDKAEKKLYYSGANRPVFIFRKGELIELCPDRMPIGTHHHAEEPFKQSVVQLETDDIIYMFTDGYADQYGYNEKRKFFISSFKQLLTSISQLPLNEQYHSLVRTFFEWKSLEEQTDDVMVVGFKPF